MSAVATVRAGTTAPPPEWALWQRHLIDLMNEAAPRFQERYTRRDGTFVWRETWPGFDGSDDGYESYHNWPLFYTLGGSADIHERSRYLWEAVTRQFTAYGQIYREFDAHYDWMHHGESSIYFYYFGLADPTRHRDRARALRFAGFYTGKDDEARNWDPDRRMIVSPMTGSRGPRFVNTWEDWATHRSVLAGYPPPFEDIPGVSGPTADWTDDQIYADILDRLNARQMRCDVPLNLTATSLVTHAYTYTGEPQYRQWVLDYVEAWADRIAKNDGICPDNVGPNGIIGETMGGKWWGGYYGWRWPHGLMTILQPLTIAAMNAVLLTGDMGYLDIPRGQIDHMIALGRQEDGMLHVPHRHLDAGWSDYRPLNPECLLQIWAMSQADEDLERIAAFPDRDTRWDRVAPGRGKGDDIHIAPWFRYITQQKPDYPLEIMHTQWNEIHRRLERQEHDDGDPETWDVHHWQELNPVHTEALLQLTCGGPQIIYHGGLLHVRMRSFDREARRPGLPPDVGALITGLQPDSMDVTLVNSSPLHNRSLILQAGAFGEHSFTRVTVQGDQQTAAIQHDINDRCMEVSLRPCAHVRFTVGMRRFCHQPSYAQPV